MFSPRFTYLKLFKFNFFRPKLRTFVHYEHFILTYFSQRQNYSAKLAFFIPNEQLAIIRQECKCEPMVLKQPLFTIQVGIGLLPNHFLYDLTNDVVQRFISTGIIQYFYEYYTWLLFYTEISNQETGPQVLSYDDLAFGFHIWIVMCCISSTGFMIEKLTQKFFGFFIEIFAYFSASQAIARFLRWTVCVLEYKIGFG